MTEPLFPHPRLSEAFAALRQDLVHEDGPRISTMRNYRFAILQYEPSEEFAVRGQTRRLATDLVANGWVVVSIDLKKLFLERIRGRDAEWLTSAINREKRLAAKDPERGMRYIADELALLVEGPDGLAADCARLISEQADKHPDSADRMLAIIGRAGGVYPFFRSSALLRHLDGRTRGVPVVLLYPGERRGPTALSFMGQLAPDADYRPRIYS
ncbi:MAG: DUF1788 domain-containing protein [Planctomycetes bacterium]|nr:DUF1788 domain-containing protein [Planctomycetota bacterium]MBM4057032.1 DUF1788 domain-containing protein [Planctomycetota bacterium]